MLPDHTPAAESERPLTEDEKPGTIMGLSHVVAVSQAQVKPSYHEKVAIGITLAILIFGYAWGMYTVAYNFARAGSLIVTIGIIFAALDLSGRFALLDDWVVARLNRIRPALAPAVGKKGQERAQEKIERREILEGNVTSGVKHATDHARVRLRFIEVTILILGTLVSGFGDLIVVHLKP
jgi:hypothetical protein